MTVVQHPMANGISWLTIPLTMKNDHLGISPARCACGASLVLLLTACGDDGGGTMSGGVVSPAPIARPPDMPLALMPPAGDPMSETPDDYLYYPGFGIYYSANRHQYLSRQRDAWLMQPTPFGVPPEVLVAAPSVHMDIHDHPAHHQPETVQRYPKNWSPADAKGNRQSDQTGEHR
jgi:hypothetical protein